MFNRLFSRNLHDNKIGSDVDNLTRQVATSV